MFNVGDSVEYFGVSQGRWIPAKAVKIASFEWQMVFRTGVFDVFF